MSCRPWWRHLVYCALSVNGRVYIIPHYCVDDSNHHHGKAPVLHVDVKNLLPVPSQGSEAICAIPSNFITYKLNHFSACTEKTVTTYRYKWNVTDTQKTITYVPSSAQQVSKVSIKNLPGSKENLECCPLVILDSVNPKP